MLSTSRIVATFLVCFLTVSMVAFAAEPPVRLKLRTPTAFTEPTTGMAFVLVKGGCYQMGSPETEAGRSSREGPVHEVCVDDFFMGKHEVTVAQFRKFVEDTGFRTEAERTGYSYILNGSDQEKKTGVDWRLNALGDGPASDNHPVVHVSWNDANAYWQWLSSQGGKNYRLPTEAEWEYAARGGTRTSRYWGDHADLACTYANVADQSTRRKWSQIAFYNCDDDYVTTAPVGRFKPNAFGLHDMLGNVEEWTSDFFEWDYYKQSPRTNPQGPNSDNPNYSRVIRGGSWGYTLLKYGPLASNGRAAERQMYVPTSSTGDLGFRLVAPVK